MAGESIETQRTRVDTGVVDGHTGAEVPTGTVIKESAGGAGDTVVGSTQTFSTLEVTYFTDVVFGVSTFSALFNTALTVLGDLEVSFSGFTTGAATGVVATGSAGVVAGLALEVDFISDGS